MKARLQRFLRTRAALPAACYLAAALLWLAWGGWRLLADSGLQSWETPAADFELADLAPEGDGLVTTSQDPQMVLPDVRGQNIRTVSYTVTFGGGAPREMCLYYSPHRDERRTGPMFSRCRAGASPSCGWTPAARTATAR